MLSFQKLAPIMYVSNIGAEVAFYEALGFEIECLGDEFPDFVSMKQGGLKLGLEVKKDFEGASANLAVLLQFEVDDLNAAVEICRLHKFQHTLPRTYSEANDAWSMRIWTPNGWKIGLESHRGKDIAAGT